MTSTLTIKNYYTRAAVVLPLLTGCSAPGLPTNANASTSGTAGLSSGGDTLDVLTEGNTLPTGAMTSGTPDTDTDTATATATGTTANGTTDASPGCMQSSECLASGLPICEGRSCVACTALVESDEACASRDAAIPACAASGDCVQCTAAATSACDGLTPVCEQNVCAACTSHDQCGGPGCHKEEGSCLPADRVWHVDGDAPSGGDGSQAAPYDTITDALAQVGAGQLGTIILHELNGASEYQSIATIAGAGQVVAILAATGDEPRWRAIGGETSLRVESAATVYLEGLVTLGGAFGTVVAVDATLYADECQMLDTSIGILAFNSRLVVRASMLEGFWASSDSEADVLDCTIAGSDAAAGGVLVDGSDMTLRNTVVTNNVGGGIRATSGSNLVLDNTMVGTSGTEDVVIIDQSSATILYSTLVGDISAALTLNCNSAKTVTVRNSIVVGGSNPMLDCPAATITNSLVGNASVFDESWFDLDGTWDLHIMANAADFEDIAVWQTGDPSTDIDGTPRPTEDGTPDYAGADIP